MPLQALDDSGSGDTISVASAVTYATDHGASVINLSLGSTTDDPVLHAAINYALAKNVVVVAAAGNTGAGTLQYPAAYAGVVSVGATDQNHKLASFSGITSVLSVLAPGVNVLTDSWSQGNQTTATAIESGTSFSTAIVSGLAGLMRSAQASTNTAQLLDALQTGGVSLSYNGRSFNEVNAANALQALGVPPGGLENVSRLFNPGLGTHFFTIDPTERDIAISQLGFRLEGDAFIGYPTAVNGYVPVFRLYNVQSHQHFYTADASEATIVQTQLGYRMDGVGFYASSQAGLNLHPVYRLLQQHTGEHFYTTSLSERSALASQGWNPEGVAWYGY